MATDRETRTTEQQQQPPRKLWPGNAVDHNPATCPNCGSTRNHVVKTFAATETTDGACQKRWHDCSNCGMRFTTSQRVPPCDVKFCRTDEDQGQGG